MGNLISRPFHPQSTPISVLPGQTNTTSNNQTIPHNTAKMKFTPVAFAGLLALAKGQDVVDDIKSVGEDIFSDVGNGFSDIVDNIHTEFDDIVAEVTGGAAASYWSDRLASVSPSTRTSSSPTRRLPPRPLATPPPASPRSSVRRARRPTMPPPGPATPLRMRRTTTTTTTMMVVTARTLVLCRSLLSASLASLVVSPSS